MLKVQIEREKNWSLRFKPAWQAELEFLRSRTCLRQVPSSTRRWQRVAME
jgi:hypothetical protein